MAESEVWLETERLRLVPVRLEDAATILAGGRPDYLKFADGYPGQFSLEVMDLLAGERRDEAAGFAPWFMLLKATGEIIGEIGGSRPDGGRTYGVGYDVIEPMQRQGYATEALKALLSYLLDQPDVDMVAADTFPDRIASRRVMEKAGMSYARTIRRVEDGEERDVVVYEIKSRRLR